MSKHSYDDLTFELLHSILTYDSETGDLYWKSRPVDMFKTLNAARSWNTKWANKKAGCPTNTMPNSKYGYWKIHIKILGKNRIAHKIAWFMYYGYWPKNQIDHINGNPLDNRIENLRDVCIQDNHRNKSRFCSNTSGVTGVSWNNKKKKWIASIRTGPKPTYLGSFINKEDAIAARKEAEIKYGFHENHGRENPNAES